MTDTSASHPPTQSTGHEPTLGALVHDLSTQIPELVRSELRLAQAEMKEKGKHAGLGIGMFSGAGLMAFYGVATLIATAVIALALVLPWWLSGLIIGVALLVVAGVLGLVGKGQVGEATPAKPERATEGVREDIATVKGHHS